MNQTSEEQLWQGVFYEVLRNRPEDSAALTEQDVDLACRLATKTVQIFRAADIDHEQERSFN